MIQPPFLLLAKSLILPNHACMPTQSSKCVCTPTSVNGPMHTKVDTQKRLHIKVLTTGTHTNSPRLQLDTIHPSLSKQTLHTLEDCRKYHPLLCLCSSPPRQHKKQPGQSASFKTCSPTFLVTSQWVTVPWRTGLQGLKTEPVALTYLVVGEVYLPQLWAALNVVDIVYIVVSQIQHCQLAARAQLLYTFYKTNTCLTLLFAIFEPSDYTGSVF